MIENSRFDGSAVERAGWLLFCALICGITFGFGIPYCICKLYRWETGHTVVNGRRLSFHGRARDFFLKWIGMEICVALLSVLSLLLGPFAFILIAFYVSYMWVATRRFLIQNTEIEGGWERSWGEQEYPAPQQTYEPFNLKSKDLVTADGMMAYCTHYGFTSGTDYSAWWTMFERVAELVAPDKEVVMSFTGYREDREGESLPVACAVCNSRVISVWEGGVSEIPVEQVLQVTVRPGAPMHTLEIQHQAGSISFQVSPTKGSLIADCLRRSIAACACELFPDRAEEFNRRMSVQKAPPAETDSPRQEPEEPEKKKSNTALWIGGGAAAVVLCVVSVVCYYKLILPKIRPPKAPPAPSVSMTDPSGSALDDSSAAGDESLASNEPKVPQEYLNALEQAQSYSDTLHLSKQGIYDQLTSEYGGKFPAEAAQYAIDNVEADFKANALAQAENYYNNLNMSKEDVRDQLTSAYGGRFTQDEADYAIENLH